MSKFLDKLGHSLNKRFKRFLQRHDKALVSHSYQEEFKRLLEFNGLSKSQYHQDLFVLAELGFKRDGFFVEFGATNGIELSNSYLLEKSFGWRGILAEPARVWHGDLVKNRSCHIETNCVWRATGEKLTFNQVDASNISTLAMYSDVADGHEKARRKSTLYEVETISLNDLLEKYQAPQVIDYLSIDTEGSEFEILKAFDFNKHQFKVITCEHNHMPVRQEIFELLASKGYSRKLQDVSMCDDWYIKA
ncbi:FkbM family methyltransferase [Rhodoferax sp. TS-BS-61-7]|uniref:FkbM family methyltransferase n=1 Tax=Rhodoferax sp. TS-BS-61-7 TaxID=2094194 RepID=UPI000CF6FB5A|nr:FkbM family methyltransferase [Rhodoferax sp. TS-BS-61-7]PQA76147.1 methyltransferase [Rhodoferax sp. TS-BS-61-7]